MALRPPPELNPGCPVFLLGPTASGKSALALEWARAASSLHPVILSMDSMQIYRGADIGTGKPNAQEQSEFTHGGLDLIHIGEPYDVAQYIEHARVFLEAHRDRPVLIVGGTGLYFRALTTGLSEIPSTPPELREELSALPISERLVRLRERDPQICAHIDLNNPRRVQRALEVVTHTGTSLLEWQRRGNTPPVVSDFRAWLLQRDREALRARISARVAAMFEAGWIRETSRLIQAHGQAALENFAAIGYGSIAKALSEANNEPERILAETRTRLLENVTQLTHQYARRQLTWFRRETKLKQVGLE